MRHRLAASGLAALLALTVVPVSPGAQPTLQGWGPALQGTMPDPFQQPAPQRTMPDPFAPAVSRPAARTEPPRRTEAPRRTVRRARPAHRKHHVVRPTQNQRKIAEGEGYRRISDLVNFPKFFPSLGILFVKPETLPLGPFLCFDRKDRLMATVYMVSIKDIDDHKAFEVPAFAGATDHVNIYFNPGHPGVDVPHYHFVIWHVTKKEEERVAN